MKKSSLPKLPETPRLANLSCGELPPNVLARWNQSVQAKEGEQTIAIYEVIGEDFFGEGVTAKKIAAALEAIGDQQVVVSINSPGGNVFEAIAIYNLLRAHPRKVTVKVVGIAASAASVIAMAGDEIQIARAGFFMIHNVWIVAIGNRHDMAAAAEFLEPFDAALADVYAARTGSDKDDVAEMMDNETWLSGSDAIEQGFADHLLPADEVEEKKDNAKSNAAATRRVDAALRKQGVPRSERRALLRELTGTPSAAAAAKPSAGEDEKRITDLCRSIYQPQQP